MDMQPAIEFVVRCHAGQTRKGLRNGIALPYVTHCFDVFKTLWLCGACDDVTGPAALGHDLVEECPGLDHSAIQRHLGDRATEVILELTFIPDPADTRSAADQKAAYMRGFHQKSLEALAVKACDRYVNVVDFLQGDPAYAPQYLAKGEAVFEAVDFRRSDIDNRFGRGVAVSLLGLRTDLLDRMKH